MMQQSVRHKEYRVARQMRPDEKMANYVEKFLTLYRPCLTNDLDSGKSTAFEYLTCLLTGATHWADYKHTFLQQEMAIIPDIGIDAVNDEAKIVFQCKLHPTNNVSFQYGNLATFCALAWRFFPAYRKVIVSTKEFGVDDILKQLFGLELWYIPNEMLPEL